MLTIHVSKKVALLYGVDTAAGMACLHQLLDDDAYSKIIVLSFQSLKIVHKKLKPLYIKDESLHDIKDQLFGDDLFIFLSNYFNKDSQTDQFVRNNYLVPLRISIHAKQNNVNQVALLSSSSTMLKSFFLPHKTREELERNIKDLDFWAYYIYKPTLLITPSKENPVSKTLNSFISKKVKELSSGFLDKVSPVEPETLVSLMINNAQSLERGYQVISNEMIILHLKENINNR